MFVCDFPVAVCPALGEASRGVTSIGDKTLFCHAVSRTADELTLKLKAQIQIMSGLTLAEVEVPESGPLRQPAAGLLVEG